LGERKSLGPLGPWVRIGGKKETKGGRKRAETMGYSKKPSIRQLRERRDSQSMESRRGKNTDSDGEIIVRRDLGRKRLETAQGKKEKESGEKRREK